MCLSACSNKIMMTFFSTQSRQQNRFITYLGYVRQIGINMQLLLYQPPQNLPLIIGVVEAKPITINWNFSHILLMLLPVFCGGLASLGHRQIPAWWRHPMETFSALLAICAGNSRVPGEFPAQRPVTRSFDVFFDLRLNQRLSKQSWCCWFETLPRPWWRHCNMHKLNAIQSWQRSLVFLYGHSMCRNGVIVGAINPGLLCMVSD